MATRSPMTCGGDRRGQPEEDRDIAHDLPCAPACLDLGAGGALRSRAAALALSQQRFGIDDDAAQGGAQVWHVPVAVQVLGDASVANLIVSGSAANRVTFAGCGPALLNVGQSGYFRSHYAPETSPPWREHYASLRPQTSSAS